MLRDLDVFVREVGIYLLVVILASGGAFIFQPLIAGDDWGTYADRAHWQGGDLLISVGKPLFALFSRLAQHGFALHPFDTVLFYSALTVFAFTVFRRWSESSWTRLLAVALFLTSPFLAEHLQFSGNQIPLSCALLLLGIWFASICTAGEAGQWLVVVTGACAAALAIATRHELFLLMIGAAVVEVSRAILQGRAKAAPVVYRAVCSLAIATALAVAVILLAALASGVRLQSEGPYGYGGLVRSPGQIPRLVERFTSHWTTFLFGSHHLFPASAKVLTWVIAAAAVLQGVYTRSWSRVLTIVTAALLLSTVPLALGLINVNTPYRYNGVFPLALYPCYLACVAMTAVPGIATARRAAGLAGALIVAIGAANLSGAQVRLGNLNRLEFATITQFLAEIRASGASDWKVALLGKYADEKRAAGGIWSSSVVECGVFNCQTERLGLLLDLTLLETNPQSRVYRLTGAERAALLPQLDALPAGSSKLVRLASDRWVILLK